MARQQQAKDCVAAFKKGEKSTAKQLLNLASIRLAAVRTKFQSFRFMGMVTMVSLLHLAAYWGWKDVVVLLVTVHNCATDLQDEEGNIPLHYAANNGHLEVVKYFITELNVHPLDKNYFGNTPLHFACDNGHLNTVKYFVADLHCNPSYAVNNDGWTPLHYSSRNGHLAIVQLLIEEARCNPSCKNKYGSTPMHLASINGYLDIIKYLVKDAGCNPSEKENGGYTPLHRACCNGHRDIAEYLVSVAHCDPSCTDNLDCTPLHYACTYNHAHIVQYLLSTSRVNPLAEDKYGDIPVSNATEFDVLKLFYPFVSSIEDYPVHTYTKLILTGNSGAGKTTTANRIIQLAGQDTSTLAVDTVAETQPFTEGIIPHQIKSTKLGNFVVYDFAGHQEYHACNDAILEHVIRKSAVVFLCLIDLSKSNETICQSLHYWLTFINNACSIAEETSHVAIVGSHSDQVSPSDKIEEKRSLLQKIALRRIKRQKFVGYVAMDCRCCDTSSGFDKLTTIIAKSHKAIIASQLPSSYYCNVLYAFLHTKMKGVGYTLRDLVSAIDKENEPSLSNDLAIITELLTVLSDKGLIIFMHKTEDIAAAESSWVVVKTDILLNEINGTLFAPPNLRKNRDFASNTGIVPVSNLREMFPHHNPEMLKGFFLSLDFCRPVSSSVMQYSNLQSTSPTHCTADADLLFFPGLIQVDQPENLVHDETLQFGWCLGCVDPYEFFGFRFHDLLLLSIAYRFPLAARHNVPSSVRELQRRCTVWKNGISWKDSDEIRTVVEFIDKNRWVLLAMSCSEDRPVEHAKLRSALISLIRCLQQKFCPSLEVCEYLISPSCFQKYPLNELLDTDLFDIQDVAMSILLKKPSIPSLNENGKGRLLTQSLPLEPYHIISPSSVCQLFNSNMADQPVPSTLLHELRTHFSQSKMRPQVCYKELREQLDSLSIFAGRNPLVSCKCILYSFIKLLVHDWFEGVG